MYLFYYYYYNKQQSNETKAMRHFNNFVKDPTVSHDILNQVIEKDYDSKMKRTQNRPIPSGRVDWRDALNFGVLLCIVGSVYLFQFTNILTGGLSLLTIILYLFVYTPSKRVSTWNTVIGSIPGALPPLGGWAASTGNLTAPAWILFGILFFLYFYSSPSTTSSASLI